jgi:hypothetical protein
VEAHPHAKLEIARVRWGLPPSEQDVISVVRGEVDWLKRDDGRSAVVQPKKQLKSAVGQARQFYRLLIVRNEVSDRRPATRNYIERCAPHALTSGSVREQSKPA